MFSKISNPSIQTECSYIFKEAALLSVLEDYYDGAEQVLVGLLTSNPRFKDNKHNAYFEPGTFSGLPAAKPTIFQGNNLLDYYVDRLMKNETHKKSSFQPPEFTKVLDALENSLQLAMEITNGRLRVANGHLAT